MEEWIARPALVEYLAQFGFVEKYEVETKEDTDTAVVHKKIDKGIFKNVEEPYYGIFAIEYSYKLERLITCKLSELKPVEQIYSGERYFLVLSEGRIYSFNKDYVDKLNDIILQMYEYDIGNLEYYVADARNGRGKILLNKTRMAYFVVMSLNADYSEEERIILSSKLEQSQRFFQVKAPKNYNWGLLKDDKSENFEKIAELLLQKEKNIIKVSSIGKTKAGDRGRDFEVLEALPNITYASTKKWLVQCKYSGNSISPKNIGGWVERVIEHNYDGYWLITNNDLTPDLFDQLKDATKNPGYKFETKFWQRFDLHVKMNLYNELFDQLAFFNTEKNNEL